jgi:hypothetical protein
MSHKRGGVPKTVGIHNGSKCHPDVRPQVAMSKDDFWSPVTRPKSTFDMIRMISRSTLPDRSKISPFLVHYLNSGSLDSYLLFWYPKLQTIAGKGFYEDHCDLSTANATPHKKDVYEQQVDYDP